MNKILERFREKHENWAIRYHRPAFVPLGAANLETDSAWPCPSGWFKILR